MSRDALVMASLVAATSAAEPLVFVRVDQAGGMMQGDFGTFFSGIACCLLPVACCLVAWLPVACSLALDVALTR